MTEEIVDHREIEVHLSNKAWSERHGFEFDHDVPPQVEMVKQEVDSAVVIADSLLICCTKALFSNLHACLL